MILEGSRWANWKCSQWKSPGSPEGIETMSLAELSKRVEMMKDMAGLNGLDPADVPVLVEAGGKFNPYCLREAWLKNCAGGKSAVLTTRFDGLSSEELHYEAPDIRPPEGEYWESRGPGFWSAGYIKSREAGRRLRRMCCYVLEKDEPRSHMDYRESEPDYIQFKFCNDEFDGGKLCRLVGENNGILTEPILRRCIKRNKTEQDNEK